jgi:DNA-binding response OmpR family regulator
MTKSRILIVDDDPNLSRIACLFLEKTKRFEVRVENRSALALKAAQEFRPAMILLDVDMPGKDGGDVCRELESDPLLRCVPILFFTSLISRAEAGDREVVRAGKSYLAKPVNPKGLVEAVDRMLAGRSN